MDIPDLVNYRETLHGHGAKGMVFQEYEDTQGLGIRVHVRIPGYGQPQEVCFFLDALPDQSFASATDLREAAARLTDAQVEAERQRWPQVVVEPEFEGSPNRCRLCPREPKVAATKRATLRDSWRHIRHYVGLCDAHAKLAEDPVALQKALDEEVARRKRLRAGLL